MTPPQETTMPRAPASPPASTRPSPPDLHDEDALDEALEETFPASDPIAISPEREQHDKPEGQSVVDDRGKNP
jgi:hypothetical protein